MKNLTFSKDALRTLVRMPANTAHLIRRKLAEYAADPAALRNSVKALRGEPEVSRLRVGDWRVIFTETGEVIAVIKVAPRSSAYD